MPVKALLHIFVFWNFSRPESPHAPSREPRKLLPDFNRNLKNLTVWQRSRYSGTSSLVPHVCSFIYLFLVCLHCGRLHSCPLCSLSCFMIKNQKIGKSRCWVDWFDFVVCSCFVVWCFCCNCFVWWTKAESRARVGRCKLVEAPQ